MSVLTTKTKDDFEKWLEQQPIAPYKVMFWDIPKIVQVAYIIEWFDSVGLQITVYCMDSHKFSFNILIDGRFLKNYPEPISSRSESILTAVSVANEMYNNKTNKKSKYNE